MSDAGGLQRFEQQLHPDVLRDVRSWRTDPELAGLLAKLRSHTETKAFFDAWAEAVAARYLRSCGCALQFEVLTPHDRRADFQVSRDGARFFLHIKRLDSHAPPTQIVVSSRLRVLERIRRPYIVQVRWREGADDDDMQTLVQQAEAFILQGKVGDEHRVRADDGREIGGVRIVAPITSGSGESNPAGASEHVTVTFGLPTGFVDMSPRIRRLFDRAHEQFMPRAVNVIMLASSQDDDVIDFETALLGTHIERWDQFPPRGQRVAHGRAADGFWHGRRFGDSQFAVWMKLDASSDRTEFRLYKRRAVPESHVDVQRLLESLFEGT